MKMIIWFGFVLGAMSAAGKDFLSEVGQRVTLECGVSPSQSLEWRYNSDLIFKVSIRNGATSKGTGHIVPRSSVIGDKNLQISSVEEGDAGQFSCLADSLLHEHTLNVVSVSVIPSTSLQKGSEATLQCLVKGPAQKTSKVQWKKPDGSTEDSPTVQLKAVDASHEGSWQCIVTNTDGTIAINRVIKVTDPTVPSPNHLYPNIPKPSHSPNPIPGNNSVTRDQSAYMLLGLSWWIWVVAGVGIVIMIILLTVVIVMVKSIRRKKKKFQKMKNARLKPTKYCQCRHQTAAPKPQQGRRREKPSALPLQPLLTE